mgnify:CR=1 FL=1
MKILITGGTGLIGRALIKKLNEELDDYYLTVLTRDKLNAKNCLPYPVDIETELEDIDLADYTAIINLAGEPIVEKRWNNKQKHVICESRWRLTEQLTNKINAECSIDNPIRFISGSAVGFYGRQDKQIITEEFKKPFPEFSHVLCQRWEDIASQASNANVCLLRTGIVLSPDGGALAKMLLPFKLGLGGKVASGEQYMPWIHIDDMTNAIIYLLKHPVLNGPYNLTAPESVPNDEFCKTLANVLHRPCIFPMPEFVLNLLFGEMADLLIYGQNVKPQALLDAGFQFQYPKLLQALSNLLVK